MTSPIPELMDVRRVSSTAGTASMQRRSTSVESLFDGRVHLVIGFVMDVCPLAVAVEDHDEFCRAVAGCEAVRGHGGELGNLAGLDDDLAFAEQQSHPPLDDEEPVVTGMDSLRRRPVGRLEPHLDRDRGAGRPAQHPGRALARAARRRSDDHVVVATHVEEGVQADLEGTGERDQDVETDRPFAGLDPTDRRRTQVGACGDLVERQPQGLSQTSQPSAHQVFDLDQLGHRGAPISSCEYGKIACSPWRGSYSEPMSEPAHRTVERHCAVAVIGGSAAGLAAALQLGRQRRSVIVVDAGEPRNAPAAHMHGYLGHEGVPPSELTSIGREEVRKYGGEVVRGRVVDVTRADDDRFRVDLVGGNTVFARRVLAATGLVDELPDIVGLADHWGGDVIHCPFCHGFEVRDRRIVQIVTHRMALHPAGLFRQLSDRFTLVLHDGVGADDPELEVLRTAGVNVVDRRVGSVVTGDDGRVAAVQLIDGDRIGADAVVISPRFKVRAEPLASLGLKPAEHQSGLGDFVETDATGATAISGVYAAGNVADPSHQVLQAAAHGSRVGAMIRFSLAHEDIEAAARPSANEADWDHRYLGDQMWSGKPNGTLIKEIGGRPAGRALDVGAGEGGDALWLAEQGWNVTASDISQRALERVAAEAQRRGLRIECHHADANALGPFEVGAFDLVSAQYASIPRTPDGRGVRNLLDAVAPGGTLLVVSHDLEPLRSPIDTQNHSRPFDPDAYVRLDDVATVLADSSEWEIEVHEKRLRPEGAASASYHVDDIVLRARHRVG